MTASSYLRLGVNLLTMHVPSYIGVGFLINLDMAPGLDGRSDGHGQHDKDFGQGDHQFHIILAIYQQWDQFLLDHMPCPNLT